MKHGFFTRAAALVLALILALFCVSCAGGGSSVSSSGNGSASQQDSQIVLTDQAGREVVLDHPAQTVVSCYYITTYATIALGVQDRVVGLEKRRTPAPSTRWPPLSCWKRPPWAP